MRDAESGPVNGAKSFMMVAPLVLVDAVCAALKIKIRHFLRMKVLRMIFKGMQKKRVDMAVVVPSTGAI